MRRQRRKQPTKSGLESPKLETNENIERRQMRYYAGFSINYRREWTFLDTNAIINGPYLFIAGGIVFCFVLLQSFVFLRRAWKRGKEIGLSTEKMKNAVSQSAVFSIVPSIPIVLALIALAPTMGIPFSWIRLSVIGSMSYEVMAAGAVASSAGIDMNAAVADGVSVGMPLDVFASAMWVMTIGILAGLLFNLFFLKKYQSKIIAMHEKNARWTNIMVSALFMGIIATLGGQQIARGGVALATLLTSAAIMVVIALIARLLKQKWMEEFALPVAILGSLALSTVYVGLF